MEGNHEKRYFKGVQGVKGQEGKTTKQNNKNFIISKLFFVGELFGIKNLLKCETNHIATDDIIQRTELQYNIIKNKLQNEQLGVMDVIFGDKEKITDEEFIKWYIYNSKLNLISFNFFFHLF